MRAAFRAIGPVLLAAGAAAATLPLACATAAAQPLKLHVKSPDWRDQIIYFVMTDRFANGDTRNDDQGAGEFDPTRADRFNGGDLKGLRQQLPYIQGLGATALWLTPPVANQWIDPLLGHTGYHGYWAQHFKQVDAHLGTLADYRRLSDALHRRGMHLVQDVVVNHVGNYFDIGADGRWRGNSASRPSAAPTQWPFSLNDPRRAADRAAAAYHWTPALIDTQDRDKELNWQMSGLDDLNTENPLVRRALRDSIGFWIREAGVDALRVDTAFYVPPVFFADFMHSRDPRAPGMVEAARRTGRRALLVFGEGFGIDRAGQDGQARRIESYVTGPRGQPLMSGMLNFPLYGALLDVFARGRPPAELADRVQRMMRVHRRPHLMPSFIDNHDVDRWLAGGSEASMKQALLAVMTLPGIPVLYYGTEQGFSEQRAAMFAAGFGSGGRDRYDTTTPLYRYTAQLSALRRAHRLFSRGTPVQRVAATSGPGALAWTMEHAGETALVVFNTAEHELLLDAVPSGGAPGARWQPLFGIHGLPQPQRADASGAVTLRLPARGAMVWKRDAAVAQAGPADTAAPSIDPLLHDSDARPAVADFDITGTAAPGTRVRIVVDGDLERAPVAQADAQGRWQARIDTRRMAEPEAEHRVVAWAEGEGGPVSAPHRFRARLPWRVLADEPDPEGDDLGPRGDYSYPTHDSFVRGQMDLTRVRVLGAGGALRVELTMRAFSRVWGPPNGFDHVAFSIFIELPGRPGGERAMPMQQGELPEGMRWHRRLRAHGWSNALFSDEGASAGSEGRVVTPSAAIDADAATRTVRFTVPAAALGDADSLRGARLWITTWDYDGGWRPLSREGGPYTHGGGDPLRDMKVMDAALVRLP